MAYEIEIKDVSPTKVVQTTKPVPFSDLRKEAAKLYSSEKDHLDTALIALVHEPKLAPSTPVTVSYPTSKQFTSKQTGYEDLVIQRSKVVFTHHFGSYDSLEESFAPLLDYMAKYQLTPQFPLRIIFHKSVKYKSLFQRKPDDFVTEIQIPIA